MASYIKNDIPDLLAYYNWVDEVINNLKINWDHKFDFTEQRITDNIRNSENWYGHGVTYEELQSKITQYRKPELIEQIYDEVKELIPSAVQSEIPKPKVKFNPTLGVFSFDRAAMGLYRNKEWYSPTHNRVVDEREIFNKRNRYYLIEDKSPVEHRWEQRENGKPKVRTTNKKVFAITEKNRASLSEAVDIFLYAGSHAGTSSTQMLHTGISAILTAEILENAGIKTRIRILVGSSNEYNFYGTVIPVKDFGQVIDRNLVALLSSDSRFFRHAGFKGILASYEHFGASLPFSYGSPAYSDDLEMYLRESNIFSDDTAAGIKLFFGGQFDKKSVIADIKNKMKKIDELILKK
jgi:hypothetical protein